MKLKLLLLVFLPGMLLGQSPGKTSFGFKDDFNFFWTSVNDEYCYFDKKQTDWQKVKEIYTPIVDTIQSRAQFVSLLEKALYEIYDHHASLNTNNDNSQRLVPSGTDIWAEYINGKPIITEVKQHSGAEMAQVRAGMEVVEVNGIPVNDAIKPFLAKTLKQEDAAAKSYALRLLLAGNHIQPRVFRLKSAGGITDYFPDKTGLLLEHRNTENKTESFIKKNTGYIKINDCLYDNDLIPEFDSIMQQMKNTRSLILDLRNTGSGGNTTVAKAILGWFINKDHFYQKHEYYAEEKATGIKRSWVEIVSPRRNKYYDKPLVILVNHWTGSIAEGITIGFDALKRPRTKIIGTEMARLMGAVYTFELPNTKLRFSIPIERLYHINGLPRENYIPGLYIDLQNRNSTTDSFLEKAIEFLTK
jgi:carboxyl-terminal processing protease